MWTIPPTSFYVPFSVIINFANDGSNVTLWDDGKMQVDYPPPLESASDYQKATAMKRRVTFNNTEVQFFFNQTVAEFRNGIFYGY